MTTPNPPFDGTEAGVVEAALAWWKHWRNTVDMTDPCLLAYYNDPVTRRLVCAVADLHLTRNPATVHYRGVDGRSLCGMIPRDLDGEHHRAIDYYNGDASCERCNAVAQQAIETVSAPWKTNDDDAAVRDGR